MQHVMYLDLAREVVNMWDVTTVVIVPIVVWANGLIAKSLEAHFWKLAILKSELECRYLICKEN